MNKSNFSMLELMRKLKKECDHIETLASDSDLDINEFLTVELESYKNTTKGVSHDKS